MSNKKGFIQIPLLIAIIAGVLVLGGGGYFGLQQYQSYQVEKIEQKKQVESKQKAEEEQRQKLQELFDSQNEELQKQKSEIEALQNRKPETITKTIVKEAPVQKIENDLPTIIDQWEKYIGVVSCTYYVNGEYISPQFGSGVLLKTKFSTGDFCSTYIQTNKHVVLLDNKIRPTSCKVYLEKSNEVYEFTESGYIGASPTHDASQISFDTPVSGSCATNYSYINELVLNVGKRCTRKPKLGEKIVILGYPVTGSDNGITATEGIISGYEGNFENEESYYITSAKIERGNSGGAAILLKDNCYLGIPTLSKVGEIESLGRILELSDLDGIYAD